jgi:hypothetical protein
MDQRDQSLVRELCHEVDVLASSDPRIQGLDVLEKTRLRMNDFLWQEKYKEAEVVAYAILLMLSGDQASQYLLEDVGDQ